MPTVRSRSVFRLDEVLFVAIHHDDRGYHAKTSGVHTRDWRSADRPTEEEALADLQDHMKGYGGPVEL